MLTLIVGLAIVSPVQGPDDLGGRLDAALAHLANDAGPGAAVGVVQGGQVVYARGYGLASLENGNANGPGTIFRIGSVSKQFTAMCIAILAHRGEIDLDADIRTYLEDFLPLDTPVTVRHLLHHTSGLREYMTLAKLSGLDPGAAYSPGETREMLARQKGLVFAPGDRYRYTNSNYFLLGEIVREVSGKSLKRFAQDHLFSPLGMESTHFHDRHDHVVEGRAFGYSPAGRNKWALDITTLNHVGDGGVFTNIHDLAKWMANLQDSVLEGGDDLVALMETSGVLNDGTDTGYGFGLYEEQWRGQQVIGHGGAWVGYLASTIRLPDHDTSVMVLANSSRLPVEKTAYEVAAVVLDGLPEEETGEEVTRKDHADESGVDAGGRPGRRRDSPPLEDSAPYVGTYWSEELQCTWRVAPGRMRADLRLDMGRGNMARLHLQKNGSFEGTGRTVEFHMAEEGISGFTLHADRLGSMEFVRLEPVVRR